MPLYAYNCSDCDASFEALVRPKREEPSECRECGGASIKRQMTSFAVSHSELDVMRSLDPMYKRMVDDQMAQTPEAEPMRLLNKLTPFNSVADPGEPIDF